MEVITFIISEKVKTFVISEVTLLNSAGLGTLEGRDSLRVVGSNNKKLLLKK